MTQDSAGISIARIERALARIEAAAKHPPAGHDVRLREHVQLALTSLDTVIARVTRESNARGNI